MNQAEQQNDHGTITGKLSQFLIILTLELVSSSMAQFMLIEKRNESLTLRQVTMDLKPYEVMFFVFSGISAFMHFLIFFWAFTLMWKTFLFRQGLMNQLMRNEFPSLYLIPLHFLLFALEKGYRIVSYLRVDANGEWQTAISIHDDWIFLILFWLKNITGLFAYAGCIKTAIYVMHPSYYKPYRWFRI